MRRETRPADAHFDLVHKKDSEAASKNLTNIEKYYTWGMNALFEILVELLIEPTSSMCYRKMNLQHVENLMHEMQINPGNMPNCADVVPWHPVKKSAMSFEEVEKRLFQKSIHKMQFFTVSGQHSAQAAKNLIAQSREPGNQHLLPVVAKLKIRNCRVLRGDTPEKILVEILETNNSMNKTVAKFKSPFMDVVCHARNQYQDMKRPSRPEKTSRGGKADKKGKSTAFQVNDLKPSHSQTRLT